ncbi:MAG: hypothetical protein P8P29_03045 [Flavobacteriaceae bacterium]|nr:hypothetical protein [Flavobacteriaceae bacterium]
MKLFTTSATIKAAIEDIRTTGKKLDQMIQVAACSVIQHNEKHGDVTLINTLVDAMPNGSRVNALRDFILTFGKVAYDDKAKEFKFDKNAETDLPGAQAMMWTEFKPEQAYVAFDLSKLLAGVLKKADAALKDEKNADNVDLDLLERLRDMAATVTADAADPVDTRFTDDDPLAEAPVTA